jgi:putative flavoprotein involved in K+ transport
MSKARAKHSVVVIGAGPAGLGVAAELKRRGISPLVLERSSQVGASWRRRYEGLRLNNDRWSARLPHAWMPRRVGRWPARDDFVAYLERYAERHGIEVRFGVDVLRVERKAEGWLLHTSTGPLQCRFLAICTGHDRVPRLPDWPGADDSTVELLHAAEFQRAEDFSGRDVLIVGIGTSATEIATRLADRCARRVRVAVRTPPNLMPAEFLGVPITVFARMFQAAPASLVDQIASLVARITIGDLSEYGLASAPYGVATELATKGMGPVIDRGFAKALKSGRLELVAAVTGFNREEVLLADGKRIKPEAVIAATGYRPGLEEMVGHLAPLANSGVPIEPGAQPRIAGGLYFCGYRLPLSGELSGMRRDSRRIAKSIAAKGRR